MRTATEHIKARIKNNLQMVSISIRMPSTVIEELKELAPLLGFSGYQPLLRAYVGQGMRKDQEKFYTSQLEALTDSLRNKGVSEKIISSAVAESRKSA